MICLSASLHWVYSASWARLFYVGSGNGVQVIVEYMASTSPQFQFVVISFYLFTIYLLCLGGQRAKPDEGESTLRTHMGGENCFLKVVF